MQILGVIRLQSFKQFYNYSLLFWQGDVHFKSHWFVVLKWYENVCVCVCGWNELEVCNVGVSTYISSFCVIHKHMHTRILKLSQDSEPMGLKVDIAFGSCFSREISELHSATFSYSYIQDITNSNPLLNPQSWEQSCRIGDE